MTIYTTRLVDQLRILNGLLEMNDAEESVRRTIQRLLAGHDASFLSLKLICQQLKMDAAIIEDKDGTENPIDLEKMGAYVKDLRKKAPKKMSQERLAEAADVSTHTITRCENMDDNPDKTVNISTLVKILEVFARGFQLKVEDDYLKFVLAFDA